MARPHLEGLEAYDEIRHTVQELKAEGTKIPPETRAAIKACQASIQESRDAIRAAREQLAAEWTAAAEDREADHWTALGEHLDNIIALQGTVLEEGGKSWPSWPPSRTC